MGDVALVLTASSLPWALKFLFGFLIDRYTFLPMGRRRIWIIGAQTFVLGLLLVGAILNPAPADIALLAGLGFAIQACMSAHDVAVDGLAVDILSADERPRVSAWMFGGQALGNAVAAIAGGLIISIWGIGFAYAAMALWFVAAFSLTIALREREADRRLPWSTHSDQPPRSARAENSWRDVFSVTFKAVLAPISLIFLSIALLKGFHSGVFVGATPVITSNSLGWGADNFGILAGLVTVVAAIVGMFAGGRLGGRFGLVNCLLAILMLFAVLDVMAISGAVNWTSQSSVIAFATAWVICDVLSMIFVMAIAMTLCDKQVGAAQFAIFMAVTNLGNAAGAASIGLSNWIGGPEQMFLLTAATHTAAVAIIIGRFRSRYSATV